MVVLPNAIAVLPLALTPGALRAAGGRSRTTETVEVPARPGRTTTTAPGTTAPGTTAPSGSAPSTTRPGGATTTVPGTSGTPTLDTSTPKVKVADLDGRFEITVPRSWVSLPGIATDTLAWQLFEQDPAGEPASTDFQFIVRWFPANGCPLERCAAEQVERLTRNQPALQVRTAPETVAGQPSVRLDAALPDQRLVDWVVLEGDRYWVLQLIGPPTGFDQVLAVVEPVLATMSFG